MVSSLQSNFSLSKWHIAIALGTTGAFTLGYYMYRSRNSTVSHPPLKNVKDISQDEDDPKSLGLKLKIEGNGFYKAGKYVEAIKCYTEAIEKSSDITDMDLAMLHQNRAAAYELLRKWSAVIADCTKAIELNSKYTKALQRRARAYEALEEYENALEDITAVCIIEQFQNQNTIYATDRILRQVGQLHANEAYPKRKPTLPSNYSIHTYLSLFKQDPVVAYLDGDNKDNVDEKSYFAQAIEAIKVKNYDAVIDLCSKEIDKEVEESNVEKDQVNECLSLRGTFYLLKGMYTESQADFERLTANESVPVKIRSNAMVKLAALNIRLERPDLAEELFTNAMKIDETNCDLYYQKAEFCAIKGDLLRAIENYEKAVECNKSWMAARAHLLYSQIRQAASEMNITRMNECLQEFTKLLDEKPLTSEIYSLYAQILVEQQQFDEADKYFDKALQLNSDNGALYVQRAVLHAQWNGNIAKAVQFIEDGLKNDPKCQFAYEIYGSMEVQRGNLDNAIKLFEQAIELANTEEEMCHLFSLRDAALAQKKVIKRLKLENPSLTQFM